MFTYGKNISRLIAVFILFANFGIAYNILRLAFTNFEAARNKLIKNLQKFGAAKAFKQTQLPLASRHHE
jgi:hypothetical protein